MSQEGPILRYAYGEVDARPFDHNALTGIDLPRSSAPLFPASFANMSPQEREHTLDHSIAFSPEGGLYGWQDVRVAIDGQPIWCHISTAIGPGYDEFADAVANMQAIDELEFGWAQEPGSYRWCISRVCDVVFVEPPSSRTGFVPNVFLRWDALLHALDPHVRKEALWHEKDWWFNQKTLSYWNTASDEDLLFDLEDTIDRDFEVVRTPVCTGWHGEPWEELLAVAGDHVASYCDSGMDALVEAIDTLADGQDVVFRHGAQPGGPHDWFISRRRKWVLLDNPALGIEWGIFSYEKVRAAFSRA